MGLRYASVLPFLDANCNLCNCRVVFLKRKMLPCYIAGVIWSAVSVDIVVRDLGREGA